jgi:hypothetical protein
MRVRRTRRTGWLGRNDWSHQRGSAVLLVLAFLFILELLIVSNARTLDHLKRELKFIEKKQQEKFRFGPGSPTNQVPAQLPPQGARS